MSVPVPRVPSSPGASEGLPPRSVKLPLPQKRPYHLFVVAATGPGLNPGDPYPLLNGMFASETGWPFVLLDHFTPKPNRISKLWIVQTRDCPQVALPDPLHCFKFLRFDERGQLREEEPDAFFRAIAQRKVLIQVQGNLNTADSAVGGLLWSHTWLDHYGALPEETVMVAFDWPGDRIYRSEIRDVNEKCRRAFVAGYHLAKFLQAFPIGSDVCMLGHSYGGRVIPTALHLLGGGRLKRSWGKSDVELAELRPDLHLRAILIEAAIDHHWLNPGRRLGNALTSCERILNLYNSKDRVLRLYPTLFTGGGKSALGRVGLLSSDKKDMGDWLARYEQKDITDLVGDQHTLLNAIARPEVAAYVAPVLRGGPACCEKSQ